MGLIHAQLLQMKGLITHIVDTNPQALAVAKKSKIGTYYHSLAGSEQLRNQIDAIIVCNGDPESYQQATRLVKSCGQINVFSSMFHAQRKIVIEGKEVDIIAYHLEEKESERIQFSNKIIKFSGALGYEDNEFIEAYHLLSAKQIDPSVFITKRLPLKEDVIQSIEKSGLSEISRWFFR